MTHQPQPRFRCHDLTGSAEPHGANVQNITLTPLPARPGRWPYYAVTARIDGALVASILASPLDVSWPPAHEFRSPAARRAATLAILENVRERAGRALA